MNNRAAEHATFTIERHFDVPPTRAFAAWAEPEIKARWFAAPSDKCKELSRIQDFRVGGRDHLKGAWHGGQTSTFDAIYHDIVPNKRIIYSYEMHLDEKKISVSLATIEFKKSGSGTKMTVTEQGTFLDGYDDSGSREQGTKGLLDKLEAELKDLMT